MVTTIIYENSFGIISQWSGEVLNYTTDTISIKFNKNKVLKFNLKDSEYMVVCKKKIKPLNVLNNDHYKMYWESFDESLRMKITEELKDNIKLYWTGEKIV